MVSSSDTVLSQLSKKEISIREAIRIDSVRSSILDLIKTEEPKFDIKGFISINELNKLIEMHIKNLLELDKGELTKLDNEVLESLVKHDLLSKNIDDELNDEITFASMKKNVRCMKLVKKSFLKMATSK